MPNHSEIKTSDYLHTRKIHFRLIALRNHHVLTQNSNWDPNRDGDRLKKQFPIENVIESMTAMQRSSICSDCEVLFPMFSVKFCKWKTVNVDIEWRVVSAMLMKISNPRVPMPATTPITNWIVPRIRVNERQNSSRRDGVLIADQICVNRSDQHQRVGGDHVKEAEQCPAEHVSRQPQLLSLVCVGWSAVAEDVICTATISRPGHGTDFLLSSADSGKPPEANDKLSIDEKSLCKPAATRTDRQWNSNHGERLKGRECVRFPVIPCGVDTEECMLECKKTRTDTNTNWGGNRCRCLFRSALATRSCSECNGLRIPSDFPSADVATRLLNPLERFSSEFYSLKCVLLRQTYFAD